MINRGFSRSRSACRARTASNGGQLLTVLFEQIHPVFVRDYDGWLSAGTEWPDRELRSDSRRAVDDVLRPIAMTPVLVPDQERRPTRVDIAGQAVGPHTLSGHEVEKAVTVEIGHLERVRLREARIDLMLDEHVARLLLVPPDTEVVRRTGYDVRKAVAIHVENVHLGAIRAEIQRRERPRK